MLELRRIRKLLDPEQQDEYDDLLVELEEYLDELGEVDDLESEPEEDIDDDS